MVTLPLEEEQVCIVCNLPTKFIYRQYDDFKVRPPRCLGCFLKFPPDGFIPYAAREFKRTRRWIPPYKHHLWAIISQDRTGEDWFCLYCKKNLSSPLLGYPITVDCRRGSEKTLRGVVWAHINLDPRCPKCRRHMSLVKDKIAYKYRVGKTFFPYICEWCP